MRLFVQHKRGTSSRVLVEQRIDDLLAELSVPECDLVLRGAAKREPQGRGARMLRPHSMFSVLLSESPIPPTFGVARACQPASLLDGYLPTITPR